MIRKLLATTVITGALFGLVGMSSANAVTIPPGDGQVSCGVAGKVRVVRPVLQPTVAKVIVSATISGCTYNGIAVPFVAGTSRSVILSNPAAVCAALESGSAAARTSFTIEAGGTTYATVAVNAAVSVTPSPPGSLIDATGSTTINGVAINAHVAAQTDRPLHDLCTGATQVLFLGTGSLAWDRP